MPHAINSDIDAAARLQLNSIAEANMDIIGSATTHREALPAPVPCFNATVTTMQRELDGGYQDLSILDTYGRDRSETG